MDQIVKQALGRGNVDYLEIRLEERVTTTVNYQGQELEAIGSNTSRGGNVRALHKGGWGFASFNTVEELGTKVAEACKAARLVGHGTSRLAPAKPAVDTRKVELPDDPRKVPLAEKEALARKYNQIIISSPGIISSGTTYRDVYLRQIFANTEGSAIDEERIYCGAAYSAVAKDGSTVQRAHDSIGGTKGYQTVQGLEPVVEAVVKDTLDMLKADKVAAGTYTVVMDPKMCGVFAHEAFGHLSESDFIYENDKLKKMMTLGTRFGGDHLSIVDDATIAGERGFYHYDEEGVPAHQNYLIRDGVLVGRLHSRETAGKMGEQPTGSARAIGFQHPPIVRMGCTYIEPRGWTLERMLGEVEEGIYVASALGGMTELEMFTFSAMKAYRIVKGRLGPMVRDVILSGNVFETLQRIDAIGNDLSLHGGLGGCGKGGQSPLPVSHGGPHIRIRNVIIGGR